ncbi:cysteine desulfurase [Collinsella tanakaei]|nr:cysteine desulfurase [Collinsella tanakaei]
MTPVNLDYAASTPMRPEARAAQAAYDASDIAGANPNSLHTLGRKTALELERCRRTVARTLGSRVRASEVIFTGGGTEANHLALAGMAEGAREHDRARTRVLVSAIEHDSMLDNLPALRAEGFTVELLQPNPQGIVDIEELEAHLTPDVALVSVMLANNETGVVQPIAELAAAARRAGALFHTDAIQGYLHIPFDVNELGVDALSLAGHKIGGPVGTGALYLRSRTPLRPQILGGGQESGRRAGTQDVRTIVALAAAAEALHPHVAADAARIRTLADRLYERLCVHPAIHATMGDWTSVERLPGIVSVTVDGHDTEELVLKLDAAGFEVSGGSACSSASLDASHVLTAMGIARERALGALRISFDDRVDPKDLDRFADTLLNLMG